MRHGLIDEYLILVQPFIWAKGKRLFDGLDDGIKLKLIDTRTFKSGVVFLHYLSENSKCRSHNACDGKRIKTS